jgi:hypothetical protein
MNLEDFEKEDKGFLGKAWDAVGWKTKATLATVVGVPTLAAAAYFADYAYVAANEANVLSMGFPLKSEGAYTEHITQMSEKGVFPCTSQEGILQTQGNSSGASTSYQFSIRRGMTAQDANGEEYDVAQKAKVARDSGQEIVMDYRHSHIAQESFDTNKWLSCIQKRDHAAYGIRPVGSPAPKP